MKTPLTHEEFSRKGGKAGIGKSKARTPQQAREAALIGVHKRNIRFAPVAFLGLQPWPGQRPLPLYNLLADFGDLKAGSTISPATIAKVGGIIPPCELQREQIAFMELEEDVSSELNQAA